MTKEFTSYLKAKNYTASTIKTYNREVSTFIKWCNRNHLTAIQIDYKDCLKYIKYLNRKHSNKSTVKSRLGAVKIYLNYLVNYHYRTDNPIEDTTIKGVKRNIKYNLLNADELEDLYYCFESGNATDKYVLLCAKRDKIITGFIVYQGLDTKSLKQLKLEHLQLSRGKLHIPRSSRSNSRSLELKPWQIMELSEYLNQTRIQLQKRTAINDYLFPYDGKRFTITNSIIKKLKNYNHKITDIKQLRASVITEWTKQYNLRQVQYMAGHRYISSTERYLEDDLENLHDIVNNCHPIS